jgi:hypothetical protein
MSRLCRGKRFEIFDDLCDFLVFQSPLGDWRHLTTPIADNGKQFFVGPIERDQAWRAFASALWTVTDVTHTVVGGLA